MEISKILITAVLTCALTVVVSQVKSEFSFFVQLCAVAVIIVSVLSSVGELFSLTEKISASTVLADGYVKLLLKALVIALSGRVVGEICSDTGNRAVGACVDIACKISLLLVCLPMLNALLDVCAELIAV